MYYKKVNLNKRGEMIAFLKNHYRYATMNSWNRSTSYANSIKLYTIEKPPEVDEQTWWRMFEVTEWQDRLLDRLEQFGREHDWLWQAGINGRSGGYLVLYRGGIKPSGYKSYCTHCGQKNYQAVPEGETGLCGRCEARTRINYEQTHMQVFTQPGMAVDMHEDFADWPPERVRERVKLVQAFDRLSDSIVEMYKSICRGYRISEEEILVPKTIHVLEPIGG